MMFLDEDNIQASTPPKGVQALCLVHLPVRNQATDIVSTIT